MKLLGIGRVLGRGLAALGRAWSGIRRWRLVVPGGRGRIVSLVLGSVVLVGAGTQVGFAWATALPADAVLRVGDTVVTEEEFRHRVETLEALYGLKPPERGAKRDTFNKHAAKSVAVSLILDQAAQQRGIVIADKHARDALNKLIKRQLRGGRDAFTKFLSRQRIFKRDVLNEIKSRLATNRLFNQVTAEVKPVTDKAVRQAYQDRKKKMVRPETRQLRNIVVKSKKHAHDILNQAQAGADFATLAQQHSLDQSTKDAGGELGTVTANQLAKQYAKAAFKAGENSFFGPVKTKHGWNIGQVVKIIPKKQLSFAEVKKQLKRELNNERKLITWRTWLGNQTKTADVEYADEYWPDNPDTSPTDMPTR